MSSGRETTTGPGRPEVAVENAWATISGNRAASSTSTAHLASGANIVCFTTGRGSAFGSKPAPTIKLATNDALFHAMCDDMDLNCGDILSAAVTLENKAREIVALIIANASGQPSKSEELGLGDNEFVPWQIGAVM